MGGWSAILWDPNSWLDDEDQVQMSLGGYWGENAVRARAIRADMERAAAFEELAAAGARQAEERSPAADAAVAAAQAAYATAAQNSYAAITKATAPAPPAVLPSEIVTAGVTVSAPIDPRLTAPDPAPSVAFLFGGALALWALLRS